MKLIKQANKIKISKKSIFRIPLYATSVISCKINDVIEKDTVIGEHILSELLNEYDLTKLLKIKVSDAKKHVNVLNGEIVKKGDLLASKTTFASLGYYDVSSDKGGIVDLSRISEGILSIYDHKKNIPIYPECNGIVTKVIPSEYIEIETNTITFNLSKSFEANDTYGKFMFISKANIEKEEYKGNIVFVNSTLNQELYTIIKEKHPILAIFPTIDASFITKNPKLDFPVVSYWGYSKNTSLTPSYRNLLTKMNLRIANYIRSTNSLIFPLSKSSIQDLTKDESEYVTLKVGDKIISLNSSYMFEEGDVVEVNEYDAKVKFADKKSIDISFDEILGLC